MYFITKFEFKYRTYLYSAFGLNFDCKFKIYGRMVEIDMQILYSNVPFKTHLPEGEMLASNFDLEFDRKYLSSHDTISFGLCTMKCDFLLLVFIFYNYNMYNYLLKQMILLCTIVTFTMRKLLYK